MKVAILGYDVEGRSSYDYYTGRGDEVTILDQDLAKIVPAGAASVLGDTYLDDLDRFDLIVRTAGLAPHLLFEKNPSLVKSKVTTQVNAFFEASPMKNIIGVTGTKGKGTTSTLITKMLEAAGKDVQLAGNIGVPALDLIPKLTADSWAVLELSSFQLIDLKYSPSIAVCLMVAPEHLNWHTDMAEYVTGKQQLFVWQTFDDIAIYYNDNEYSTTIASAGNGAKVPYFAPPGAVVDGGCISINGQIICHTKELKLLGQHNWQNACAAVTAAWQITHSVSALRSVLTSFSGLPHRLELVRELDGVAYYDDSFGTTPETAIVAVQSFTQPKVIILGGSDKGASYDELSRAVKAGNVRKVLLIGDQAARIQTALEAAHFTDFVAGGTTMDEIVAIARSTAQSGDVVLLSTGCASFDMFANYKKRGEQFKQSVADL